MSLDMLSQQTSAGDHIVVQEKHQLGGGSSTEGEGAGYWSLELDDHERVEARAHGL